MFVSLVKVGGGRAAACAIFLNDESFSTVAMHYRVAAEQCGREGFLEVNRRSQ